MSSMGMLNKVCTCLCCHECACGVGECYDTWTACESCGLAYLQCGACCWTICAPVCHSCTMGDVGKGMTHCLTGLKYCAFACLLNIVAPCDGCINCVLYSKDVCTTGVTGFADVMKNTMFLGGKVKDMLGLQTSNEPEKTFKSYTP